MSPRRILPAVVLAATALAVLATPAGAHVSIPEEVEAGGIGMVTLAVPNERDDASTVALEVKMPEDRPLALVSVQEKPGWESEVTMRTLDEPVELFGNPVTEVVDTIRWTGGSVSPDQFDTFTFRAGPFPEDVDALPMPAVQVYDSGEEVAWIEVAEGDEDLEHPAPVLTIAAATNGGDAGAHGITDQPETDDTEAETAAREENDEENGTDVLTVIALVVAVIAAGLAGAAFVTTRQRS